MMLGYLLARKGVDVVVLEKHEDFLRDFRGDTVHPSTMNILDDLSLLDAFLSNPHDRVHAASVELDRRVYQLSSFAMVPSRAPFIAMMPQWDFLNFLASEAAKFRNFCLLMSTKATALLHESGPLSRVCGVRTEAGQEIRCHLVVGCDGRRSTIRQLSGLPSTPFGVPIDVLWFRIARRAEDESGGMGKLRAGSMLVLIPRNDYWQCAFLIRKGTFESDIQARGLPAFREALCRLCPSFDRRLEEGLTDWSQVFLLSVQIDRMETWFRDGLLCIGDAAHAMSPVGGVGVNLAVQDAVATANLLGDTLAQNRACDLGLLAAVQARRMLPTRIIQWMQRFVQERLVNSVLLPDSSSSEERLLDQNAASLPWSMTLFPTLFNWCPPLRWFLGYALGIGFRAERVNHN